MPSANVRSLPQLSLEVIRGTTAVYMLNSAGASGDPFGKPGYVRIVVEVHPQI